MEDVNREERAISPEELAKHVAWQKSGALDALAQDHESRARLFREAAAAIREKAGISDWTGNAGSSN